MEFYPAESSVRCREAVCGKPTPDCPINLLYFLVFISSDNFFVDHMLTVIVSLTFRRFSLIL